jgi:hypothetical protein
MAEPTVAGGGADWTKTTVPGQDPNVGLAQVGCRARERCRCHAAFSDTLSIGANTVGLPDAQHPMRAMAGLA